jgi:hypothetical protein
MGHLSLNDLMGGMRHERSISPRRAAQPPGMPGMGLGDLAGKKSKKRYWAAVHAKQAHEDALAQVRTMQNRMESDIGKIRALGTQAQNMGYEVQSLTQGSDSERAFAMIQSVQTSLYDVQAIVDEAEAEYSSFEDEFNAARAKGGNYAPPLVPKGDAVASKLKTLAGRAARASSMISSSFARVQAAARKAAQGAAAQGAAEAERLRLQDLQMQRQAEMEQRRYDDQLRREEQQRAREDEARAREREYEAELRREEQQRAEADEQREAEERARRDAADQARIDAELRREQMAIEAEQRRFAMEQERILREEERELRKEEREGELQRLMMMQELASKGVPIDMGPPGAASMGPVVPGFGPGMMPGMPMPGMPGMPMGYPGMPGMPPGMPMGYPGMPAMQPGMPAMAPQPGMPAMAPQPGYAAQPPAAAMQQYQQGGALPAFTQAPAAGAIPGQAPPPGMAWAAFDPASEMFGMGAFAPANNPTLQGAQIETGYVLRGQGNGPYQILWAQSGEPVVWQGKSSFSISEMMAGPIHDTKFGPPGGGGGIVYYPPSQSPSQRRASQEAAADAQFNTELARGIFGATGEIAKAVGGWAVAREDRKAAKRGGRRGGGYVDYNMPPPDYGQPQGGRRGGPGPLMLIGALGIGAAMLAFASSGKKKKTEE